MAEKSAEQGPQPQCKEVILKILFHSTGGFLFSNPVKGVKTDSSQDDISHRSDWLINPQIHKLYGRLYIVVKHAQK